MEHARENKKQKPKKQRGAKLLLAAFLLLLAVLIAVVAGRELEKRTYRLDYPEEISAGADEFGLDPYLVAAMIHCESGNRAKAISPVGAVGLMQIMPDTGEWIAGKLDISGYEPEKLTEPAFNIRMGCWYLRFLLDRYEQDRPSALAAYNAGHGNVDKWKNDPAVSVEGELKNIPFAETEQYLEKVQRAYEKYKTLYQDAF